MYFEQGSSVIFGNGISEFGGHVRNLDITDNFLDFFWSG